MRRILVLVVALAMVAVGCSSNGVVGTVDGETILVSDVSDLLPSSDDGAVEGQEFSTVLFAVIADIVLSEAGAEQFGIELDETEYDVQRQQAVDQLTAAGQPLDAALAAQGLNEARLDSVIRQQVLFAQIEEALTENADDPTEEEIEAAFAQQSQSLANVCAAHILLETEEDAQAAIDRAAAGEDFAALAMELSTGPSGPDGGDLGCGAPAQYVAEFAVATMEAEVGVPYGPVQTQFGFHVILVSERTAPTLDEAREEIVASMVQANSGNLFFEWAIAEIKGAEVDIDERYGTWVTEPQPTVLPPGS